MDHDRRNTKVYLISRLYRNGHLAANRILSSREEEEKVKLIEVLWFASIVVIIGTIGIIAYHQGIFEENIPTGENEAILDNIEKNLLEYEIDLLKMRREMITDNTIEDHRLKDEIRKLTTKLRLLEEKINASVEKETHREIGEKL